MHRKHDVRALAMQILFAWDAAGENSPTVADQITRDGSDRDDTRRESLEMATGAHNNTAAADAWLERLAPQWPPRRQPGVDRAVLRLAVYELTNSDTPPKVVLDEAIELAKEYSTEQSASFVNGVLDAVLKEHQALIKE